MNDYIIAAILLLGPFAVGFMLGRNSRDAEVQEGWGAFERLQSRYFAERDPDRLVATHRRTLEIKPESRYS